MGFLLIRTISRNLNITIITMVIKMIDLHTHILPNLDDGANSLEEAIKLTESLYKQNIRMAVCTPHFDPTQISLQEFIDNRTTAMELMRDSKVALLSGSETILHDYLFHYPDICELCIENTKYLLLELPYSKKWNMKVYETLENLITYYDIIPIIAHVERYLAVKKSVKCIKKLIGMGCVLQINTSSIIDKKSRKQVVRYMIQGYIDVLGSDCHNMTYRYPDFTSAFNIIIKEIGLNYYKELELNAEYIVNGIELKKKATYSIE